MYTRCPTPDIYVWAALLSIGLQVMANGYLKFMKNEKPEFLKPLEAFWFDSTYFSNNVYKVPLFDNSSLRRTYRNLVPIHHRVHPFLIER